MKKWGRAPGADSSYGRSGVSLRQGLTALLRAWPCRAGKCAAVRLPREGQGRSCPRGPRSGHLPLNHGTTAEDSSQIFAIGRRRRPSGRGQRDGEMAPAASVSAAKTPTAEPVSEGAFSRLREKAPSVAEIPQFTLRSKVGIDAGIGSRGRVLAETGLGTDTHGLLSGGSEARMCPFTHVFGHGLPETRRLSQLKPRARCPRLEKTCSHRPNRLVNRLANKCFGRMSTEGDRTEAVKASPRSSS